MGLPERRGDRLLPARQTHGHGLIEAFNGRLRAECLNASWFLSPLGRSPAKLTKPGELPSDWTKLGGRSTAAKADMWVDHFGGVRPT